MARLMMILLAALVATVLPAVSASAATALKVSADETGVAIRGYDSVAFFTSGKAVEGKADYSLVWNGAQWRFASDQSLAAFKAAPERYAPQFGGYCAWAVSQHYLAPGDPNYWKIVEGKLYLNANARAKELWEADQAEAIARGHANWPGVLDANQDTATDRGSP